MALRPRDADIEPALPAVPLCAWFGRRCDPEARNTNRARQNRARTSRQPMYFWLSVTALLDADERQSNSSKGDAMSSSYLCGVVPACGGGGWGSGSGSATGKSTKKSKKSKKSGSRHC